MPTVIYFVTLSVLQLCLGETGLGITAYQNSENKFNL